MALLFTNQTTDAKSPGHAPGGDATLHVFGEFDGAELQIQFNAIDDDASYVPPKNSGLNVLKTTGNVNVTDSFAGYFVRVVLIGSGPNTDLTVEVLP